MPPDSANRQDCGHSICNRTGKQNAVHPPNNWQAEIFHSLTDGYGGQVFLNALIAEYLFQKGLISVETASSIRCVSPCDVAYIADDYITYAETQIVPLNHRKVYRLPGKLKSKKGVNLTNSDNAGGLVQISGDQTYNEHQTFNLNDLNNCDATDILKNAQPIEITLLSVSHNDEQKFTPDEWAQILDLIDEGKVSWED